MGGSAIGGDLARGVLGDRLHAPLRTIRGYELPSWAMPGSVRPLRELLRQHRGDACLLRGGGRARCAARRGHDRRPARRAGARRRRAGDPAAGRPAAARGGRLHARVGARGRRATSDAAPGVRTEIDAACASLTRAGARVGPGRRLRQPREARRRSGRTARLLCIYGAGPDGAGRRRAGRRQINENAKVPAFAAELPEADHNEIVGWESAAVARQLPGGLPRGLRPAPARAPARSSSPRA